MNSKRKGWHYLIAAFLAAILAFVPLFLSSSLIDPFVAGGMSLGGFAAFFKLFGMGFDLVNGKAGGESGSPTHHFVVGATGFGRSSEAGAGLVPSERPIIVAQPKEEAFGTVFAATEMPSHQEDRRG